MSNEEEDYEVMQERIQKSNALYLDAFYVYLTKEKKLTEKTALKHANNVAFFGNDFVLGSESEALDQAIPFIGGYLGSWFIRKCMWSTPKAINENVLSFKKFYVWMYQNQHVKAEALADFLILVKEEKDEWLGRCAKYNDPESEGDLEDIFPW